MCCWLRAPNPIKKKLNELSRKGKMIQKKMVKWSEEKVEVIKFKHQNQSVY